MARSRDGPYTPAQHSTATSETNLTKRSLIAVALFLTSRVSAQTLLTGRVTDRTTSDPIAGVVVTAVDDRGKVVIRAVTDRTNGYRIPLSPEMSRLQFRRIGYSPVSAALKDSANGRLDVSMQRLPTQLPPVLARTEAQCDPHPDRGAALALWEEARSGMLTSIVARESRPARVSFLHYQFTFNGNTQLPQVVRRVERDSATKAFGAARTPTDLAILGYVDEQPTGRTYLGPDDVVLFDETFLATHCFTIEKPSRGDDSTVGLRFEPSKGRDKIPDVEGVVWLRKNPLDLRSVEFRYVGVEPEVQRVRAGGKVDFKPMPNGISMIHHWSIRGARIFRVLRTSRGVFVGPSPATATATPTETGALIERIDWPEGPPYVAELPSATGIVRARDSRTPVPDIVVRLENTPFALRTDSVGAFSLRGLLTGIYWLYVGDPALALYGIEKPLTRRIEIKDGQNTLEKLEIDDRKSLGEVACSEKVPGRYSLADFRGSGAIFGRVQTPEGQAALSRFTAAIKAKYRAEGLPPLVIKGVTDEKGRFRLCDIPAFSTTTITLEDIGLGTGEGTIELAAENAYGTITLQVKPKKP